MKVYGRTTNNGCQVMAIVHMTFWVRWAKKEVIKRNSNNLLIINNKKTIIFVLFIIVKKNITKHKANILYIIVSISINKRQSSHTTFPTFAKLYHYIIDFNLIYDWDKKSHKITN